MTFHRNPNRAALRVQFLRRRRGWCDRQGSALSRGLCRRAERRRSAWRSRARSEWPRRDRLDGVAHAAGLEPGLDFGEDRARIFGARIVAGGDDEVASLARGVAHLGALGAVAIAAAAEERDDAAAGFRGQLARESDEVAQRVVGVRVVDDHGKGLARIDGLKAAGDGCETRDGFDEMIEGNAAGMRGGERGEQVEDVDLAGEARCDLGRAGGSFELNNGAAGRERVRRGAQVAEADAVGADFGAGAACGFDELQACARRAH